MPPLDVRQGELARAIRFGDLHPAAGAVADRGLPPQQRLRIHRHHHRISLTRQLAATYPVVARLVGERCFSGLAREFILLSPPASPCLFDYGGPFAHYLAAVPTLMALPYLPDVARLEWAMNLARHAADAPRLTAGAAAALRDAGCGEAIITLHPSVRLFASPYPVLPIWRSNQPGADPDERVTLDQGRTCLLVYRDRDDDIAWCPLSPGAFAFLQCLRNGRPIAAALARARAEEAAFDGGRAVSGLIEAGVFTDPSNSATALPRGLT